jgi:hypothetical protein
MSVVKTLNAMDGGASVDCEYLGPEQYLRDEFEVRSMRERAYDENARHLARLVLDCDERTATIADAIGLVRLLQCALLSAFAGFGRLYAAITTSARGGFHLHFPDVIFTVHPLHRAEAQTPLAVHNLLRWMRRTANAMFVAPPTDFSTVATAEPPKLRVDVDEAPLNNGVRCRIFGTLRTDLTDVAPADTQHNVVAVVDEGGKVHRMSDPHTAAHWWQRVPSAPLTLGSLSVRPNAAQVARFMCDPLAASLHMVRGSPSYAFKGAPPCELETALTGEELAALFFPTHEQPHLIAEQIALRFVNANMALAVCRRTPGDGIDCAVCRRRGAACGGTELRSLVRWHPCGARERAGDIWQCCDAAPDLIESVTRSDCRVLIDEWRVRQLPLIRLPFGTAAPQPAEANLLAMPLLQTVYERGFELGDGTRTHTAADAARFDFSALLRAMAAAEGVSLGGIAPAAIRTMPTVQRTRDYTPSKSDVGESLKPRVSAEFADELRDAAQSSDLALMSIRAPPGYGKTYLLKEMICRYVNAHKDGGPLLVLMVTALRNVNSKLRADVTTELKSARLRASVSFYADDARGEDKWWQPSRGPYDAIVRITSCNAIVRSVRGGVRPHLLLIDESEHSVAYSATAGTLGGTLYHGRAAPLHEDVCLSLWCAGAKTRWAVVMLDRDAGFNSRLCAANMALQCVIGAHHVGRPLARTITHRELQLAVRIPRAYVMLPAGDEDVLLALLLQIVVSERKRVIVADMSAQHAKLLCRKLRHAIADEHWPDGQYPNVGLLHAKLDKQFLNQVASDPLRYCTEQHIDVLIHTPVLTRSSSLDTPYFDYNVIVLRPNTDWNEGAQGESRQRLTLSQLATGVRTTYVQFASSMLSPPELVRYFADVTVGVALYACNERLLQQHRERDTEAWGQVLRSLHAVQYDAIDGRPYIEPNSRMAFTAVINIARQWLARLLHFRVFLQECRDDAVRVSDIAADKLAELRQSASVLDEPDSHRMAQLYDELCNAPLQEYGDKQYDRKVAGLCALGLRGPVVANRYHDDDDDDDDNERQPALACVPSAADAPKSPTFMQHLIEGRSIEHDMQTLHAFLTHQGDDAVDLVAALKRTCDKTAVWAKVRWHTVDRQVQTPMEATERISTVTEVLLVIAILRALQITDVHQLVPRDNGRHRCPFKAARFADRCTVRDPWPPHNLIAGSELRTRLVERAPQLKLKYRAYGDFDSPGQKRLGALLRSIVNNVLGCQLVGKRGRVDARQLQFKAAMMAAWAHRRQLTLAPPLVVWLTSLGDIWQPIFDTERQQAYKPFTPFTHVAHTHLIQRELAKHAPSPTDLPPPLPRNKRARNTSSPADADSSDDDFDASSDNSDDNDQ